MEKLIELLNSNDASEETGRDIQKCLSKIFNVYGNYSRIAEEIYMKANKTGREKLVCCWALAGIELAYEWIRSDFNDWDERKVASEKYAYSNIIRIEALFKNISGIQINLTNESTAKIKEEVYLSRWIDGYRLSFNGKEWLLGFLKEWQNTHSTLRQSFFSGVLNGIVCDFSKEFTKVYMPFI